MAWNVVLEGKTHKRIVWLRRIVVQAGEKSGHMSQCLRCRKPCEATAVFCDECRSRLRTEFRRGSVSHAAYGVQASPSIAVTSSISSNVKEHFEQKGATDGRAAPPAPPQPVTPVLKTPVTPHPPNLITHQDVTEQAITRLSEAAQRISEVAAQPSRRLPRASRLAPFRDISADIRRESTPLPKFSKMRYKTDAHEKADAQESDSSASREAQQAGKPDSSQHESRIRENDAALPDLWPWLDADAEEQEHEDTWANSTDPLISRHIPNSAESARIEEEDIRRARAEGIQTDHLLARVRRRRTSRARIAFAVLAIFAVIALVVDGVLLSVVSNHPRHLPGAADGAAAATLTLSPSVVTVVNTAPTVLHIVNFAPGTKVFLSHDIQEKVITNSGASIVSIASDGSATATIMVSSDWGPGFHQIVAEDITTRYTASATLQVVIPSTSTKPAHLEIDELNNTNTLDFGADIVGANTVKSLHLRNSGSGSITWSASSHESWLLISPNQGMFSQSQIIDIAVQRTNLKPGNNLGSITLFSSVDPPRTIKVTMSVLPLPNGGPVLSLSPAVLSFTATDGSSSPGALPLTIANPGKQMLNWSLSVNAPATETTQISISHILGVKSGWLSASPTSGSVPAGSIQQVYVSVASVNLLPGAYLGTLTFTAPGAADPSQTVSVSLTVQPHCGLVTNLGLLQFTAVLGNPNPINQALGLNETASCAGAPISWNAALSSGWLNVSPTSGQLKGTTSEFLSVGVNATGLAPKTYFGSIAFTTQQSTQTVQVELIVQPQPQSNEPLMSVSSLNINFSNTQGQQSPKGQVVTITNNGGGQLRWNTSVNQLGPRWLGASPTGGVINPAQTQQVVVNVDTSRLTPGTYSGQITLNGMDKNGNTASGSPQLVSINLVIQPPCTLTQPSSSAIAFSGVQGGFNPTSQNLLITGTGNCTWPLLWSASVPSNAPWLTISPMTGSIKGSGQSASFNVAANTPGLQTGIYTTQVTISATDSAGVTAQGSPQTFSVTLTVLPPPCTIVQAIASLTFNVAQGQTSSTAQNVSLSETGKCSRPITWSTTGDANSSAWLVLTPPSPDTGSGSTLSVKVNAASMVPGTSNGTITVSAFDRTGAAVLGTFTISVTINVTATVSGTVVACSGPTPPCSTPVPLPLASLTLLNGSGVTVATTTADSSGNYTFSGLAPGSYTVSISGTDSNNIHYSTTGIPLTVKANMPSFTLQVFPG